MDTKKKVLDWLSGVMEGSGRLQVGSSRPPSRTASKSSNASRRSGRLLAQDHYEFEVEMIDWAYHYRITPKSGELQVTSESEGPYNLHRYRFKTFTPITLEDLNKTGTGLQDLSNKLTTHLERAVLCYAPLCKDGGLRKIAVLLGPTQTAAALAKELGSLPYTFLSRACNSN
jgi:hypothetical protein